LVKKVKEKNFSGIFDVKNQRKTLKRKYSNFFSTLKKRRLAIFRDFERIFQTLIFM
jgi:hypothetical protein